MRKTGNKLNVVIYSTWITNLHVNRLIANEFLLKLLIFL